jgi:hypothetical protein
MQKYRDTVVNSLGRPVVGATVTVTQYPSGTAAAIYSDNGVTLISGNTILTDSYGAFSFYAADGHYSLTFSGVGVSTTSVTDILLEDPAAANPIAATTITVSGTVNFSGTAQRITGDFSNGTLNNLVAFQTSTVNGGTALYALPNGSGFQSQLILGSNQDSTNSNYFDFTNTSTLGRIRLTFTGAGSYLPMTFETGGSERMRLDTNGQLGLGVIPSIWFTGYKSVQVNRAAVASTSGGGSIFADNYYLDATGNPKSNATGGATWMVMAGGGLQVYGKTTTTAGGAISAAGNMINVTAGQTLALEFANSTAGTGIAFPAAQSASTDPNTLDDYEEGTWTPNQGSGLTVVGSFISSGSYTKIGRQVTVTAFLQGTTSLAVAAGGTICTNLPFTSGSSGTWMGSYMNSAGTAGGQMYTSNVSTTAFIVQAMTASGGIIFTLTYFV